MCAGERPRTLVKGREGRAIWKVEGSDGRFFEHRGDSWTADPVTTADMLPRIGSSVNTTPTGPVYTPKGPDDQAGLLLLATQTVPGPHTFSGDLPEVPDLEYDAPDGAVF